MHGLRTPGAYDHNPIWAHGLPKDLTGCIGPRHRAASGYFTFELEGRGAQVTSTELPQWKAHDFGPQYASEMTDDGAQQYLPRTFAHEARGSYARRKMINIYDINPDTVGRFDPSSAAACCCT